MSWIKRDPAKQIDRLFRREMMPLADSLRSRGKAYFERRPDANADTYWTHRPQTTMRREDFESGGCESPEAVERELSEFWEAIGSAELKPLASSMGKIAKQVYSVAEQNEDVSPFVYVMY